MQWIGKRSYGLYLWHWPVFQLTRPRVDVDIDGWQLFLIRIIITLIIVEISYQIIERPIRERRFQESLQSAFSRTKLKATFGKISFIALALIGCFIALEQVQAEWSTDETTEEQAQESETGEEQIDPSPTSTPSPTPTPLPTPTPKPVDEQEPEVVVSEPDLWKALYRRFVEVVNAENPEWRNFFL